MNAVWNLTDASKKEAAMKSTFRNFFLALFPLTTTGGQSTESRRKGDSYNGKAKYPSEHLGPLFREIFPDSETARSYHSGKIKSTCILNAPLYQDELVQLVRTRPFSLSIDGSGMNPLTADDGGVVHRLLDMCTTSGKGAGTAEVKIGFSPLHLLTIYLLT